MFKNIPTIVVCMLATSLVMGAGARGQERDVHVKADTKAVFVMNNDVSRNEILIFTRLFDGSLQEERKVLTGGRGSGGTTDPLASQGSLILSQDGLFLLAANAGSGDISTFAVRGSQLFLVDRANSGGSEPNAIAQHGDLVYVVNAAGSGNLVGFRFDQGRLHEIENSTRFLTTSGAGGSSVAFTPNGDFLVVTERVTNNFDVFAVHADGTLSPAIVTPSIGPGVFAVTFAPNGTALVSETGFAGALNSSAVSSYAVQADGALIPIRTSVPTLGSANCWNAVTPDGRFVYLSNSASANISGFAIANNGSLTPIGNTIVASNPSGATNLDIAVSSDGKFLYSLNSGNGTVGIFSIQKDGTLVSIGSIVGVGEKAGFNGIAAN
jgi:6-phosphogluconolactonase (cycloisomerase 2 family)